MAKKKETKEIAVKAPERKLAWGGSIPKNRDDKNEVMVREFCNQVAKIYGVPSMGVNAMGGQPYLNKDGRLFLLHDLRKGKQSYKSIKTDYLNMSKSIDEPSICKVTIEFKDGHTVEATGEASKQSVKLDAVKQTLNMMAETRATNRAIWKEIAGDVWDRVAQNLARASDMSEAEKSKVAEAGRVSYEEMQAPEGDGEQVTTTPAELEVKVRDRIMSLNSVSELIEIDEKLAKSPLYKANFKKQMAVLIRTRVAELEAKE